MKASKPAYQGEIFSIEFYVAGDEACPAEEWLDSQPVKMQQKFAALFAMLANVGRIFNEQKFKHLTGTDQLFEFKVDQGRVLCFFFVGKRVILTHGFLKKSDKTPKGEIERAEKYKNDFSARSKK
jgi:phage-related protein